MERLFIYIKHNLGFLWVIFENINDTIFYWFYSRRLRLVVHEVFKEYSLRNFVIKVLKQGDADLLYELIKSQSENDLRYFKPHGFDIDSIKKQFGKKAFLMMGVFDNEKLVGYFFLRFFANKKCFVGRLIDKNYRGKGIGNVMNDIMYNIAWGMNFRCLSTISKNNKAVIGAHKKNPNMVVLKELQNDYLLVEFVNSASKKPRSLSSFRGRQDEGIY